MEEEISTYLISGSWRDVKLTIGTAIPRRTDVSLPGVLLIRRSFHLVPRSFDRSIDFFAGPFHWPLPIASGESSNQ
jgi:hypothetical protein